MMKLPEEARLNEEEIWKVDNELGKDDLYLRMDDHQSVLYREGRFCEAQLAKAAPIIEAQFYEWGDSLCPHVHRVLPNRPRRACDICWETLKEGKEA